MMASSSPIMAFAVLFLVLCPILAYAAPNSVQTEIMEIPADDTESNYDQHNSHDEAEDRILIR